MTGGAPPATGNPAADNPAADNPAANNPTSDNPAANNPAADSPAAAPGPRLATLAAAAVLPALEHGDAARARLDAAGLLGPTGELAELAAWWASVRDDERAAAPQAVVHVASAGTRPAMQPPLTVRAVELGPPDPAVAVLDGASLADELADSGADLLLLSVADVVPSRVLAAHLLRLDPLQANGWPQHSGIDDRTWMQQAVAIRDGLRALSPFRGDPDGLLAALQAPQYAAATALLLRCAARRTPVLLDGPGAAGAALLAQRTAPAAASWWRAAHLAPHPLHSRLLTALSLEPLLDLRIAAEDGTGALLGLAVLEVAAGLLTAAAGPADPPEPAKAAGRTEAGRTDAGRTDAGRTDAGRTDAGRTETHETESRETEAHE